MYILYNKILTKKKISVDYLKMERMLCRMEGVCWRSGLEWIFRCSFWKTCEKPALLFDAH